MPNKRIALNTVVTYTRSLVAIGLALFSSRWILNSLGQTDYGLFSVVGSIIVFITFFNNLMSASTARHYAFSIGQADAVGLNQWFNAAVSIHLCIAALFIVVGWPIGEYVVGHVLSVPGARLEACLWVFRFSLVSAFFSMFSVPFVAMFTAKQQLAEVAGWGITQSALTFVLAWTLRYASGDRLLFFSAGMVSIMVLVQVSQIVRAVMVFDECGMARSQWFDRRKSRDIFSFALWNLFGGCGVLFRDQGSAILLNVFFGPGVNAAYGIATQVSNQTNQLSSAMIGSFSPEITACEGRGDRQRMLSLSQRASKFGTLLVLLLAVPLIVETDYVLKLWLRVPPPQAAQFCQLILGTFVIDRLSTGYMLAVQAHGKIAAYQATLGSSLLLTLPLSWMLLKMGLAPTSIGFAFIATMILTSTGRALWGRHLFGVPLADWLGKVVWPSTLVALVSLAGAFFLHCLLAPSLLRLGLVGVASVTLSLSGAWFVALDQAEREFAGAGVRRILSRFTGGA